MALKIIHVHNLDEKTKKRADAFILDESSNGEFINTIEFLSYHPEGRFVDDSIVVVDSKSGAIKSVVMAGCSPNDLNTLVSYPGTTFGGPIFKVSQGVNEIGEILELILNYYENKYSKVVFKLQPTIFATQPIEDVSYQLLKKGYDFGYSALSNVIHLTNLKDEEDLFELYQSRRRSQVRKLQKESEYEFQSSDTIDEAIWNNMNVNLMERYGISTTHSFHEITNLKEMFPKEIVPYFSARADGEYGAFALVFKFKNVFHTQYLDRNYAEAAEGSNLLLNHQLILKAIAEGYTYFSFGASTENVGEDVNQGLYDFKKTYGGGRILLPVFEKRFRLSVENLAKSYKQRCNCGTDR